VVSSGAGADPGRAHPYVCPAGYWNIGYGHLCDPKHPPIAEAEADSYLANDLQTALGATLRFCPALATEPEVRLAAIVDFTFNLGAGRLQTSASKGQPLSSPTTRTPARPKSLRKSFWRSPIPRTIC
jgi:hypothetical protein